MSKITEELYLGEYDNVEELEAAMDIYWSGSRFDRHGGCWRRGQHTYDDSLEPKGGHNHPLVAGSALHAALAYFYAMGGTSYQPYVDLTEQCLDVLRKTIVSRGGFGVVPLDHKYHHYTSGHLEIILKNYFTWAKIHDSIEPIMVEREALDLTDVVGARLRINEQGLVVLGESALIMRMAVKVPWSDKPVEYNYAGVPDLPVTMGGYDYVMDHKSTGSPLSGWWAGKFRVDNTLRVYCLMIQRLLKDRKKPLRGILINGIFTGKTATNPKSKAKKFERYGPWDFDVGALNEAALNHAAILRMKEFLRDELGDYTPQIPGMACSNCPMRGLCTQDPVIRPATKFTEYTKREDYSLLRLSDG